MKQTTRKLLSLLLSLALLCGLCMPTAFAAESGYSDTRGHWAEEAIDRWSDYGIIGGYGEGLFAPDDSITRAQMATILAKTLGLTETAENPFADISADAWYTPYILRCYAAGILLGDGANANPDSMITRQEAMTMLCRAFAIAPVESADLTAFADGDQTDDWAAPFVAALVDSGIVCGVGDDLLAPMGSMTRAAVVTIVDRAVTQYITAPGEYALTDSDGIILVSAGEVTLRGKTAADILVTPAADGKTVTFNKATVTGSITVQADNATIDTQNSKLPDITLTGEGSKVKETKTTTGSVVGGGSDTSSTPSNLTVTEAKTVEGGTYKNVTVANTVGDGEVTLMDLTIQGDLTIRGGGSNSIKLINCIVMGKIIMAKTEGEAPRLYLTDTPVTKVEVQNAAIIEAADAASTVTAVEAKAAVEVKGEDTAIGTITIPAAVESTVTVTVTAGTVETVEVKSDAVITGAADSVAEVVAEAAVTVAAEAVTKVEVPTTASADVTVTVTGSESVEVEVNSTGGVAITTDDSTSVVISTELDSTPANVTLNDTEQTHAHKWNEGEVTTAATCEVEGVKTYTCTADGCTDPAATKTESIPALGHSFSESYTTSDDLHWHACTREGCQADDGAATHSFGDWIKVDETNHKHTCTVCSKEVTEAHKPVTDAAVPATCTATGLTEGSHCSVCNGVIVEQTTVNALNHDFTGDYSKDATGHWHICSRDNCEETDTKATHSYNTTNCAEAATCTVCGYVKAAGEHAWNNGVVTTAPTCENAGVRTYTCTVESCGATKTEGVDKLGHSAAEAWSKDVTNHWHVCTRDGCGAKVDEATHTWDDGKVTTEATETTEGVKTYTCTVEGCGATKTESIPMVSVVYLRWQENQTCRLEWSTVDDAAKYKVSVFEGASCAGDAVLTRTLSVAYYNMQNIVMTLAGETDVTYSIKVEALDSNGSVLSEVGVLNGAIVVTVSGTAPEYSFSVNEDNKTYTMTFAEGTPNGARTMFWTSAEGAQEYNILSSYIDLTETYTRTNEFADGDTVSLRIFTSNTLSSDLTVCSITLTPTSTQTYTEASTATLALDESGNLTIEFTKDDTTYSSGYSLYCYDAEDNEVGYSYYYDGINVALVLPFASESGKYTLVLMGHPSGKPAVEIARLENCFDLTISGDAVEYTMEETSTGATTQITSGPASGIWLREAWFRDGEATGYNSGMSTYYGDSFPKSATTHTLGENKLADGDVYDVRVITSMELEEQVVKVTMTPASTKTYTTPPVATLALDEDYKLTVAFTNSDDAGDYSTYWLYWYDSEGTKVVEHYLSSIEDREIRATLPCAAGTYTLKITAYDTTDGWKTLAELKNCLVVTVTDTAPDYTMTYGTGNDWTAAVENCPAVNETTTRLHFYRWYRDGEITECGFGSAGGDGTGLSFGGSTDNLSDGDVFDLHVITSYTIEDDVVKVTVTPESTKTYTASTTETE